MSAKRLIQHTQLVAYFKAFGSEHNCYLCSCIS